MTYLLDTNICVFFLRGIYNLDEKFRAVGIENCFISEITLLELEYGVANSDPSYHVRQRDALEKFTEAFDERILPIRDCFKEYAQQRIRLRKRGLLISDFDILIGCTAVVNGLIMVTENLSDFNRIDNITIENWIKRL
jgi:tRNA(fMet)-specific endonuclease VapC